MSGKQKSLRSISIVEVVLGLLYCVEGLIVSTGKGSYFIAGIFTVLTAVLCYMSASDSSKAKPATILLWITVILNCISIGIGIVSKSSATSIALAALDACIAAYLIKLIKEING